jgi:hypothetical protein
VALVGDETVAYDVATGPDTVGWIEVLDGAGESLWSATHVPSNITRDAATGVGWLASGDLAVAGLEQVGGTSRRNVWTATYDGSGVQVWIDVFDGGDPEQLSSQEARGLAIETGDQIVVVGKEFLELLALTYSGDGAPGDYWRLLEYQGYGEGVAILAGGDRVLGGWLFGDAPNEERGVVLRVAPDGVPAWERLVEAGAGLGAKVLDVAASPAGPVAVGYVTIPLQSSNIFVRQLSP